MIATNNKALIEKSELQIALAVFLACLGLIAIDKDTKHLSDFVNPSNIAAFFIYFIPTFFITCLLYRLFAKKLNNKRSLTLSLLIGIPLGFTLLILLFISLRN